MSGIPGGEDDFPGRLAAAVDGAFGTPPDLAVYVTLASKLSRLAPSGPDAMTIERAYLRFEAAISRSPSSLPIPPGVRRSLGQMTMAERMAAAGLAVVLVGGGAQISGLDVVGGMRRGGEIVAGVAGALIPTGGTPLVGQVSPLPTAEAAASATSTLFPGVQPTSSLTVPTPASGGTAAAASTVTGASTVPGGVVVPTEPPVFVTASDTATPSPSATSVAGSGPPAATATRTPSPTPSPSATASPVPTSTATPVVVLPTSTPAFTPTPPVSSTPAPSTETFAAGIAGFVSLRVVAGRIELVAVEPAPGWQVVEPEVTAVAVHFKFVNGRAEVEFEASLEDGRIVHQVSSNGQVP